METQCTAVDDRIIAHLDFARAVAGRTIGAQRSYSDREDFLAWGALGLVQAARRYRDDVGATFAAFVARRVRGCVLDALRSADPLTRNERQAFRKTASLDENATVPYVEISLDAILERGAEPPSPPAPSFESVDERWPRVALLIRRLPLLERRVLILSYARGLTLKEIGMQIGLSESGACRLRSRAITRLRLYLRE